MPRINITALLRQKIDETQGKKNLYNKDTIGKIVARSLEKLFLDLEKNERLAKDAMDRGLNISYKTKVFREGLDHVVAKFDCFFKSDSEILCICCDQYNALSSCLINFDSSLSSNSLLCLSCLVLRSTFPDEYQLGGIDIADVINSTSNVSSSISSGGKDQEDYEDIDYEDEGNKSTTGDCFDVELCLFHKLIVKFLGLQAVLTHGDTIRKNIIIKSYVNREVTRVFNSYMVVLDRRCISFFSWMIVEHCFGCLCSPGKKRNRVPSLKDFFMCFQPASVDIIRASIGGSSKFYHFVSESFASFFDKKTTESAYYRLNSRWNLLWKKEKKKLEQRLKSNFFHTWEARSSSVAANEQEDKMKKCTVCFKRIKHLIDVIKTQICQNDISKKKANNF